MYNISGNKGLILSALIVSAGVLMLAVLLIAALQLKPSQNPDALRHFDSSFLARAAEYNRTSLLLSVAEKFLYWALLAGIVFITWKNIFIARKVPVWQAALIFAAITAAIYIIVLPLQYYRSFVVEHRFGLSNQTVQSWFADILKDRAISFAVSMLVLTSVYTLMRYLPGWWWIAAALLFILFIIIANFIFPVLIDPLFYKFTPLTDSVLKDKITRISETAGIKVGSIMVADASRKTSRLNAYFAGLGKTKRIVIYDNLLLNNTDEKILSVIAHEIAHWKYRHIPAGIALESAWILLMFFILRFIQQNFRTDTGVRLVLILFILYSFLTFIAAPFQNFISRQFEKQADRVSVELTQDPKTAVMVFKVLASTNLSNVDPSPVLKYLIYSHPPLIERIKDAEKKFYLYKDSDEYKIN